jgi:hypothetical protein
VVTALVLAAMTLARIDSAQAGATLDAAIELLEREV